MSQTLIQIVTFTAVGASATVALPHGLNINGTGVTPDLLLQSNGDFTVTADDTDITVTNNGDAEANCDVWAEYKHSLLRNFGGNTQQLTPAPFVPATGGGGGSGSSTEVYTYQEVNQVVDPGTPSHTLITPELTFPAGTRQTILAVVSYAAEYSDASQYSVATATVSRDSGKAQTTIGVGKQGAVPNDLTTYVCTTAVLGTITSDGNPHTYQVVLGIAQSEVAASIEISSISLQVTSSADLQ